MVCKICQKSHFSPSNPKLKRIECGHLFHELCFNEYVKKGLGLFQIYVQFYTINICILISNQCIIDFHAALIARNHFILILVPLSKHRQRTICSPAKEIQVNQNHLPFHRPLAQAKLYVSANPAEDIMTGM